MYIIMPYFKDINLLYIHIPKTGGTSIEKYFYKDTRQTISSLYSRNLKPFINYIQINNHSLQHCTYLEIYENKEYFGIKFDEKLVILASVRNPYARIISDLFHFKMINKNSSKKDVCQTIIKYLDPENSNNYDNHQIPQYKYISDNEGKLIDKIFIMSQESLTQDMISLGFKDFDIKALENKNKEVDYFDFLNKRSINLINDYYAKDFELFGYKTFEFYTENELNAPP